VIRLGLRLSLGAGREAVTRLMVLAAAVGLGVAMLLGTLATINALSIQNARGAWLATDPLSAPRHGAVGGAGPASPFGDEPSASPAGSVWWLVTTGQFHGQTIVRADVAPAGGTSPVPPGIARLPGPGQYYASPALARLLATTPADQLGDRFAGHLAGTIGPEALASPGDLVVVVGNNPSELARVPAAGTVTAYATSSASGGPDSLGSAGMEAVLAVMALVLVFPVLVFIGTATRLSAARRERRLAAVSLVGATHRQVTVIAAVEGAAAAAAGTVVGFALYLLAQPALAHVSLTGKAFQPGDLRLTPTDVLLVGVGVPVAAAVAARVALRRVRISPLGVARRATPPKPSPYRLAPLAAGVAELAYLERVGHPSTANGQLLAYFAGFLLILSGLVLAGPWLTMVGAQAMARRTRRPSLLIAGRRLSDNPRAGFRAVAGLVLALFVTSVAVGTISTMVADHGTSGATTAASSTVVAQFDATKGGFAPAVPAAVVDDFRAVPGVTAVTLVYTAPDGTTTDGAVPNINGVGGTIAPAVVSCAQLARTPALGRCHPGAAYASVGPSLGFMPVTKSVDLAAQTTWPTANLPEGAGRLPVQVVAVATDGSTTAVERAQTALTRAFPYVGTVGPFGGVTAQAEQLLSELQTSSEVVIVASLLIAGCSVAVSAVAGISERRRAFSLLRLAGTPNSVLRSVVSVEAAAPLVVIAVAACAVGLVASDLFLRSQLGVPLRPPGAGYYAIVLGGLAAALTVTALSLPLVGRIAGPAAAREG
jgi:hypothetical protein